MDGQSSHGQSGNPPQQVSVSATTVGSVTGSHSQATLSIQQQPVSMFNKTPLVFKVDAYALNTIYCTFVNIKSSIDQWPVIHDSAHHG